MKHCPHCGGDTFKAVIKRPGAIKLTADGATIIKEVPDKFNWEVVECIKCKTKVSNDDLTEDVKCPQCQTPTKLEDIVDGLCPVCVAMKNRPELANASQEELIRRLLEAEKQLNSKGAAKVEAKVADANKEPAKEETAATPVATQQTQQPVEGAEMTPQQRAAATRKANAEKARLEAEANANTAPVATPTPEPTVNVASAPAPNPVDDMGDIGITPPTMPMDDPF